MERSVWVEEEKNQKSYKGGAAAAKDGEESDGFRVFICLGFFCIFF
jgi:hypothetical protein